MRAHVLLIQLYEGVPITIVKDVPDLSQRVRTAVTLLAALLHCTDGFTLLVTITPMSLSSSVVFSYVLS